MNKEELEKVAQSPVAKCILEYLGKQAGYIDCLWHRWAIWKIPITRIASW